MLNKLYPWQKPLWQQMVDVIQKHRLPHALLFIGEPGIGIKQFAEILAFGLLCPEFKTRGARCGDCHACHLVDADTHPDFIRIESEPGHAIKVDQIRELISLVSQTTLLGGYRVIVIQPASAMNMNAANALLKTLEEPAPNTLLILISDVSVNLPATIVSRCQKVHFKKPTETQSLAWMKEHIQDQTVNLSLLLRVSQGAPLAALEWLEQGAYAFRQDFYQGLYQLSIKSADPLELALQWHEKDLNLLFSLLFSWLGDVVRFKSVQQLDVVVNQDMTKIISDTSQRLSWSHLLAFFDHVQQLFTYTRSGLNLNQRLLLEALFIKWTQYAIG